jgi:hypothetical protein
MVSPSLKSLLNDAKASVSVEVIIACLRRGCDVMP